MTSSIASSIKAALKSFNEFIQQIKAPDCEAVEGLSIRGWEDELGRLRVWAANIGAHQTNQSSLDFRLRDASHVREQIIKLLGSLTRRLDDARGVLQEGDDQGSEVSSDAEEEAEKLDLEPEMLQMQHSAAAIINRLFQMSILVRKPAQVDLRVRSSRADVAGFEPFDYGHVRDKFPRAEEALISRLGSAITTRRMHLKYRERHAAKLKQGINRVSTDRNEGSVTVLSDTMATNLRDSNIDFDEKASESGESSTSYAATLMSGGAITIPPPPIESQNGNPFECPLCFHIIKIESTKSWNKHVFLDLQPYICLDINCATPQKLYATRRDWLHHMKTFHTEGTGLRILADGAIVCPLCAASFNDEMQLAIHSARHLQDLALFVLPQSLHKFEEDDEEEESRPNPESQAHSSDQYVSTLNSFRKHGPAPGYLVFSRNSRSPLSDPSVGDESATKELASTDDEAAVTSNKGLDQNDEGEWNHIYRDDIHATPRRRAKYHTSGNSSPTRSGEYSVEDPDGTMWIGDNPQPLHHTDKTENEMEGAIDGPVAGVPTSSESLGDLRNASTNRSPEDRLEIAFVEYLRAVGTGVIRDRAEDMDTNNSLASLDPHLRHAVLMDQDNRSFAPSNEETFHEEEVEYDGYDDLHGQDAVDSETSKNETRTRKSLFDHDKYHTRKMRYAADTEFEGYGERSPSVNQKSAEVEDVPDASSYAASQVSGGSITEETKPPMQVVSKEGIPPNARWTKIDRKLVNPEALDIGGERYEERSDYVIVLRVLTKDEIERYALKTREIRIKTYGALAAA